MFAGYKQQVNFFNLKRIKFEDKEAKKLFAKEQTYHIQTIHKNKKYAIVETNNYEFLANG